MNYRESVRNAVLFVAVLAFRCATATNGRYQRVPVTSDPPGAEVTVNCGAGSHAEGMTPTTVVLKRKAKACDVTLSRDGYRPSTTIFDRRLSFRTAGNAAVPVAAGVYGYATGGGSWLFSAADVGLMNAIAGIPLGAVFVGVDFATGAVFRHAPDNLHVHLQASPVRDLKE
jgi:hypothetical protein